MTFYLIKDEPPKIFHYKDLIFETHPEVYEPAEDTFQLLEVIEIKKGETVLEIGTGCGIIAIDCARMGADVICTDINPYAVDLARRNYLRNKAYLIGNVEVRYGDLFSAIRTDEKFDVIIFNPPYLPTKLEDHVGGWFDVATDGGVDGLKVTKKYMKELPNFLNKEGIAYFVFSSLSDRKSLDFYLKELGFDFRIISTYNYDDEKLDIYQINFRK